jgi:hypothetical protein
MTFSPFPTAGTVEFVHRGHVVAEEGGAAGRFSVAEKPGTYQVGGGPVPNGRPHPMKAVEACASPRPLIVRAHSAPAVDVDCRPVGAAPG